MKLGDEILELNPMRWIEENLFTYVWGQYEYCEFEVSQFSLKIFPSLMNKRSF